MSREDGTARALSGDHTGQVNNPPPDEGLPAGEAELHESYTHGFPDDQEYLFETKHVLVPFDRYAFFRHTVSAAEVALIGDRNPQVAYISVK